MPDLPLTDFEKQIYTANPKGVLELERRWTPVFDSVNEQQVLIGYLRQSAGYTEMVDRNGKVQWSEETGVEPSIISPIDFLGSGILAGVGRAITSAASRVAIGRGLSVAAIRASGGRVSSSMLAAFQRMSTLARGLLVPAAKSTVSGPMGSVARATLEAATKGGGPTVFVATKLTTRPSVGRALSVAVGDDAVRLANAARASGQVYCAELPKALLFQLERIGLVKSSTTQMGNAIGTEYRFLEAASEFIVPFFN